MGLVDYHEQHTEEGCCGLATAGRDWNTVGCPSVCVVGSSAVGFRKNLACGCGVDVGRTSRQLDVIKTRLSFWFRSVGVGGSSERLGLVVGHESGLQTFSMKWLLLVVDFYIVSVLICDIPAELVN